MEDKKNIVIKLKYPGSGKPDDPDVSSSKVITEWNIKRILLALLGVIFFIATLLFLFKPKTQNMNLQPQAASPENIIKTPVKSEVETNKKSTQSNKKIIRALLTFKIQNNEPAGEIKLPLKLSKNGPTSVYYFVEVAAMKGRTIYHEWLLDGAVITRKKVNISSDNWRTSSRQLFAYSLKTNWTVRLVDETGRILNEIPFNVIYE
jgi:hypothetical protein